MNNCSYVHYITLKKDVNTFFIHHLPAPSHLHNDCQNPFSQTAWAWRARSGNRAEAGTETGAKDGPDEKTDWESAFFAVAYNQSFHL